MASHIMFHDSRYDGEYDRIRWQTYAHLTAALANPLTFATVPAIGARASSRGG